MDCKSIHFSEGEKEIIVNLTKKYHNIIENKRTHGVSNKQKNIAWDNIAKEFNAVAINVPRNVKQLRTFYENLKKKVKRQSANVKVELYKTGGGVSNVPALPSEEKLFDCLKENLNPLSNIYDSSASYFNDVISYTVEDHEVGQNDELDLASASKSTPSRKRTVADVYDEISSLSKHKRARITEKETYVKEHQDEKLKILQIERRIKERQEQFENERQEFEKGRQELELVFLRKRNTNADEELAQNRREHALRIKLLEMQIKKIN